MCCSCFRLGYPLNKFLPGALAVGAYTFHESGTLSVRGWKCVELRSGRHLINLRPNVRPDLRSRPVPYHNPPVCETGAGNAAAPAEIADGNLTDAFTVLLVIARNGPNL